MRRLFKLAALVLTTLALLLGAIAPVSATGSVAAANAAASECSAEQQAVEDAAAEKGTWAKKKKKATRTAKKARKAIRKAKKALAAGSAEPEAKVAKKLKKAKKKLRRAIKAKRKAKRRLPNAKAEYGQARAALAQCVNGTAGGGRTPVPTRSPAMEAFCAEAAMAAFCEVFDSLMPTPVDVPSPIQQLCEAGLPQEICDLAASDPGSFDAICGLGLPSEICAAVSDPTIIPDLLTPPPGDEGGSDVPTICVIPTLGYLCELAP